MTKQGVGGRPSMMTEETVKLLEDIFKIDGTVTEACSYAGISRETYYNREKTSEEFSDKMAKAKSYPFILSRKTLMKGIQDGDAKSAMEYLKRRDKRYTDKQEITTGENGKIAISVEEKSKIDDLLSASIGVTQKK